MKVLHISFTFPPDPSGGTELFVAALGHELDTRGVENIVVAPGARDDRYSRGRLAVRRFGVSNQPQPMNVLYGDGDPTAAVAFERILDEERPDVVHQHALSPACSVRFARAAKARGIPLVFTYHTPTVSCQRGTLLEWGKQPCDGRMEEGRCTACTLEGLGVGPSASRLLSHVPSLGGDLLGIAGIHGGAWTAVRMRSLIHLRMARLNELFGLADVIVALTPWVHSLLRINGVPEGRIVDCAHGLIQTMNRSRRQPLSPLLTRRMRLAHLGRLDPVKGTGLLIDALRGLPDLPIDMDIYGIVQGDTAAAIRAKALADAGEDSRIRVVAPIDPKYVIHRLATYDAVVVPSQGMETGPLVVLEAFAAGVPVIGSALGGIAEKVTDGVNGLLVSPPDSVAAWRAVLQRCASDPDLLPRLRSATAPPREMAEVASDMHALYTTLVANARAVAIGAPGAARDRTPSLGAS